MDIRELWLEDSQNSLGIVQSLLIWLYTLKDLAFHFLEDV